MTASRAGLPRFVAYDLANGRMVMAGMDARQILNHVRDNLWPTVDVDCLEILDCGAGGVDAGVVSLSAEEARQRFDVIFRGYGPHGLAPVALSTTS